MTTQQGIYGPYDDVVVALALHRCLTVQQITDIALPGKSRSWTQRLLGQLRADGLADDTTQHGARAFSDGPRPAAAAVTRAQNYPHVWFLTARGIELARQSEGTRGVEITPLKPEHLKYGSTAHTLAVNSVGATMLTAARTHGDEFAWQNEVRHRLAVAGTREQIVTTDAMLTADLDGGSTTWRALMELDRGTKPMTRVLDQHRAYVHYATLPQRDSANTWQARWHNSPGSRLGFPQVMWVFDCDDADRRLETFATRITDADQAPDLANAGLWVLVTTLERLRQYGPYGPAFFSPYQNRTVNFRGEWDEAPQPAHAAT